MNSIKQIIIQNMFLFQDMFYSILFVLSVLICSIYNYSFYSLHVTEQTQLKYDRTCSDAKETIFCFPIVFKPSDFDYNSSENRNPQQLLYYSYTINNFILKEQPIMLPLQQNKKEIIKVSYIWRYFDDVNDDKFIKRCIACRTLVAYIPHSPIDYLFQYLSKHPDDPECIHQKTQLIAWAEHNNYQFKTPYYSTYSRCQLNTLISHLKVKHDELYNNYLFNRNKRMIIEKPFTSLEDHVHCLSSSLRFLLLNNIPLNNLYNQEGRLYFQNHFSKDSLNELINLSYDIYIKIIQEETSESIPLCVMIDEWKSPFMKNKILGIEANYISKKLEPKHKCLGLILLPNSCASTIRKVTENEFHHFFDDKYSYYVVHDTCSVMNAAFNIEISSNSNEIESEDNVEEDIIEIPEQVMFFDGEMQKLGDILQVRDILKPIDNVNVTHQKCESHVFDLCVKKTVETSKSVGEQFKLMNKIFVKVQKDKNWNEWVQYCSSNNIKAVKFKQFCNTRFYIYSEQSDQYNEYEYHLKEFFKMKGYKVYDSDEKKPVEKEKHQIVFPERMDESIEVLRKIKECELLISSEKHETLPHVIESVKSVLDLIIEKLNIFKIEVETRDFVPIVPIDDYTMSFTVRNSSKSSKSSNGSKRSKRSNGIKCRMKVRHSNYTLYISNKIENDAFNNDCLMLLLLLYYFSHKYRHIMKDERLLVANYLNPNSKDIIPFEIVKPMILKYVNQINISSLFPTEMEIENYYKWKHEEGINYEEYWESVKSCYPKLSFLSIMFRTMAASEIGVERLFSLCGNILISKRNKVLFDRFAKICMLEYNLRKSDSHQRNKFFVRLETELIRRFRYLLPNEMEEDDDF